MEGRRRSRIVGLVFAALAGAGIYAAGTATAGGGFSDTRPWIQEHAEWLHSSDIANGYPDGTFRPNEGITRGQTAFWLGNFSDSIQVESTYESFNSVSAYSQVARCPSGKRAIGGGGGITTAGMMMTDSQIFSLGGIDPHGWEVRWESVDGSAQSGFARVEVTCIPVVADR